MIYLKFSSYLDPIVECFNYANLYISTWITVIITIQLTNRFINNLNINTTNTTNVTF